jgi:hypothetical protein
VRRRLKVELIFFSFWYLLFLVQFSCFFVLLFFWGVSFSAEVCQGVDGLRKKNTKVSKTEKRGDTIDMIEDRPQMIPRLLFNVEWDILMCLYRGIGVEIDWQLTVHVDIDMQIKIVTQGTRIHCGPHGMEDPEKTLACWNCVYLSTPYIIE